MGNENIDVIRMEGLEADLAAVDGLRPGMRGHASDTNRIAYKRLADSVMKYWSDDSKQMLLAGNQTVTGGKTWTAGQSFNGNVDFNARIRCTYNFLLTNRVAFGTGQTNLAGARAAQDNVAGRSRVEVAPVGASDRYFSFSNLEDGQIIIVFNRGSVPSVIDGDPTDQVVGTEWEVDHDQQCLFIYDDGLFVPIYGGSIYAP